MGRRQIKYDLSNEKDEEEHRNRNMLLNDDNIIEEEVDEEKSDTEDVSHTKQRRGFKN